MPPKRFRSEGSSSAPERAYDHSKFVSAEAAERFDTYVVGKALTPERGLRPKWRVDGEMSDQITEREWDTFIEQPEAAVVAIVQEFYANAKDMLPYTVTVRGRTVPFSALAINEYYALDAPAVCQYSEFLHSTPDYDRILTELCRPGTTWVAKGTRGGTVFHSKELSLYGKIWYAFLCAKLMPTVHVSDVTKDRAALLYAIVMDYAIDVGRIIEGNIRRILRSNVHGGLPHPSLICGLCRAAGVQWAEDEVVQQPLLVLDHRLISRYTVWDQAQSHPRGRGFIIQPQAEPEGAPDSHTASSSQPRARFSTQFRDLQMITEDRAKRIERQNQRLAERQEHMFSYTTSFNAVLAEQFARLNPGGPPIPFPVPQPLPPYPPSDAEVEDINQP